MTDWNRRFMDLAKHVAGWSKDPRTKVGAVLVKGKRDVVFGYNGFPAGVRDLTARYDDREFKHKVVLHAELNAILNARRDLTGYRIYVWPLPPCTQCASAIIQSGITEVITVQLTPAMREKHENYLKDWAIAGTMFEEAGVTMVYQNPRRPGKFKVGEAYRSSRRSSRYPPREALCGPGDQRQSRAFGAFRVCLRRLQAGSYRKIDPTLGDQDYR